MFAIAADPTAAEDHAITALDHADLPRLTAILTASPEVLHLPTTGALLLAVFALANDQIDEARQLTEYAARDPTPTARRAHAIRLRDLATRRPDLAAGQLAEIMDPSTGPA